MVVTASPSLSVDWPEQLRTVEVVTPVFGAMAALDRLGAVFSTLTAAVDTVVPPSLSVAVTSQVSESPTSLLDALTVVVCPEPMTLVPFNHT